MIMTGKHRPTEDPADEPTSELLKQIEREKARLVKEGKIKKPKDASTIFRRDGHFVERKGKTEQIIDSELPFDIPDTWEWVRLWAVTTWSKKFKGVDRDWQPFVKEYPSMLARDLVAVDGGNVFIMSAEKKECWTTEELVGENLCEGEVVSIPDGGDFNVKYHRGKFVTSNSLIVSSTYSYAMLNKYLYYWMLSQKKMFKTYYTGTTIKHPSKVDILNFLLPLPPLAEQERIVEKLDVFTELEKELRAEADLRHKQLEHYRERLIEKPTVGKRPTENPADEPASELLKQIEREKARLVKEGKIKKPKDSSTIFRRDGHFVERKGKTEQIIDSELPFDIPDTWEWVRLGEVCSKITDGSHNPPKGEKEKTAYIMASAQNINDNTLIDLENVRYLSKNVFEKENLRTNAEKGDILITSVGTIGRSCIYEGGLNIVFQRSVTVLKTFILNYYLKQVLDSPYYQNFMISNSTGTSQKGFYLNKMVMLPIPLPPLAEQERIVEKLDVFTELEKELRAEADLRLKQLEHYRERFITGEG